MKNITKGIVSFLILIIAATATTGAAIYLDDRFYGGPADVDPDVPELPDNILVEGEAEFDAPVFWSMSKSFDLTIFGDGGKASYTPYPAVAADSVLAGPWVLYSGSDQYFDNTKGLLMSPTDSDDGTYQWTIKTYHGDQILAYSGKITIAGDDRPLLTGAAGVFILASTAAPLDVIDSWDVSYQFNLSDIRAIEVPYWSLRFAQPGEDYERYMVPLSSMTIDSASTISIYQDMASRDGRILRFSEITTNINWGEGDSFIFLDIEGNTITSPSNLAGKTFKSVGYSEDYSYSSFVQIEDPGSEEPPAEPDDDTGSKMDAYLKLGVFGLISMFIGAAVAACVIGRRS